MVQKIPKFDCDAVTPNAIFLLVGRRRSGKSVNLMSLLHRFRNTFAWGCVICPSQTSLKDYSNVMPPQFCHESIDLDLIQKMIDYQNKRVKNNCAERIFLVLDDCACDVKACKSKVLKYLFFNSRHLKITLFISIQDCLVLSPALRANVDFVSVFESARGDLTAADRVHPNESGYEAWAAHIARDIVATRNAHG